MLTTIFKVFSVYKNLSKFLKGTSRQSCTSIFEEVLGRQLQNSQTLSQEISQERKPPTAFVILKSNYAQRKDKETQLTGEYVYISTCVLQRGLNIT